MRRAEKQRESISDAQWREIVARANARGDGAAEEVEEEIERHKGKLFDLRMKRASLKLEQNLGCELPVCVASNRETKRRHIEVVTDAGVIWRLTRQAGGHLPAPEHYGYWMWFLDRCQHAAEHKLKEAPRILINPVEIFGLFGAPKKGKRNGYHGSRYNALDAAFLRFSTLIVAKHGAFFDGARTYSGHANLGTLCYYESWRVDQQDKKRGQEFAQAWVKPGPLLWESIRGGYLKSVPLEPIRNLNYVEQRLFTYLAKHCKRGDEFAIAPHKLLPKIPLRCPSNKLKSTLGPRHEALAKVGFLEDARIDGRGKHKLVVYRRSEKRFTTCLEAPNSAASCQSDSA